MIKRLATLTIGALALVATMFLTPASAVTPNDPEFPNQWNLTITETPDAWNDLTGSNTVRVAIVAGGINVSSELSGLVTTGWNTVTNSTDTTDDAASYGSGTMQASIVAANTNNADGIAGINWALEIVPVDVCHWVDNMFLGCDAAELAEGIDWARTHGAEIILTYPQIFVTSPALDSAVAAAVAAKIPVVSGVGATFPASKYPAVIPGVIGVGSTDNTDTASGFSAVGAYVDYTAPGEGVPVVVSGGCCVVRAGTQLAAAHVAGAIALIAGTGTGITPARAASKIAFDDLGDPGYDTTYGAGRLDIGCTVARAGDTTGDSRVDLSDTLDVLNHFGAQGDVLWDINGSLLVDYTDVLMTNGPLYGADCT